MNKLLTLVVLLFSSVSYAEPKSESIPLFEPISYAHTISKTDTEDSVFESNALISIKKGCYLKKWKYELGIIELSAICDNKQHQIVVEDIGEIKSFTLDDTEDQDDVLVLYLSRSFEIDWTKFSENKITFP